MTIFEKGEATLKERSHNHMGVSGKGEIMVQEEDGLPLKIQVLVSKSLGKGELVVGLEDLNKDFPRTLPELRRGAKLSKPSRYNKHAHNEEKMDGHFSPFCRSSSVLF